jgi:pimeloyl-ACP methyl ester carboxylesterase
LARFSVLDQPAPRDAAAGALARLASGGGAFVDRVALRAMERLFLSSSRPNYRRSDLRAQLDQLAALYAAPELLCDPALFFRPVSQPRIERERLGSLPGGERLALRFESSYRTLDAGYEGAYRSYRGNERNLIHLWRHAAPGRPTLILLHAWCGGALRFEERIFAVDELYRKLGYDVALFTLPFHGGRTPRQARFSGQLFPSRDLRRTNEGVGQAVADLRCLMAELRARGAGPIGVAGMSLGGYLAAVLAGIERELAFVITIVAPCSIADILWTHGAGRPGRVEAEQAGVTLADLRVILAAHCPLLRPLQLREDRVLMIKGAGDRIVPEGHQLALWEHWGRPRLVAFAGGHLLQVGRRGYLRVLRSFLEEHTAW